MFDINIRGALATNVWSCFVSGEKHVITQIRSVFRHMDMGAGSSRELLTAEAPGRLRPTHHMSICVEYSEEPSSTSGGRYQRVTTSLEYVLVGTDLARARPGEGGK